MVEKSLNAERLPASEGLIRSLFEHSPLSVQVLGPDGDTIAVNPRWEELWGVTLAELPDYNILEDPQLDAAGALPLLRQAFAGQPTAIPPVPFVPDRGLHAGEVRWARAFASPVWDEFGAIVQVVLVHEDVTEIIAAEEDHALMVAIVESSEDAIITRTVEGVITSWNPGAERLYGFTSDEAVGQHISILIPPDFRGDLRDLNERLAQGERMEHFETVRQRKDGRLVDVSISLSPVTDAAGRAAGVATIARDISERKRLEAEATRARQMRYAAVRADVGEALAASGEVSDVLQRCAEAIVRHLDAALARIWLLDEAGEALELQASAGLHTHRHGENARIPVDQFEVGRNVDEWWPLLTSGHRADSGIGDSGWATQDGMAAFAIQPLQVEDRLVGVVAVYAEATPSDDAIEVIASIADAIAQGIERKRTEAERERDREFLTAVLEHVEDGIVACDADGILTVFNHAARRFHLLPVDALPSERWAEHYSLFHADGVTRMKTEEVPLYRALNGERFHDAEMVIAPEDGSHRLVRATGRALVGTAGKKLGAVVSMHDITERKAAEARLAHQAYYDTLTDLPNRALLMERLTAVIETPGRKLSVAVLFLDLDGFKIVNDSLGHTAGDELLVAVGWRLQKCLPTGATLARFGGDEFVVLLERVAHPDEPSQLADRMIAALQTPFAIQGHEAVVTGSTGIAIRDDRHTGPEDLLREAGIAMHEAKAVGPGSHIVFAPRMEAPVVARLEQELDLRRAVERGELRLHYQPIIALETGRVVAVEALLRWERPGQGLLQPIDFIGLAEETGLIVPLGRWVLREACTQAVAWQHLRPEDPLLMCVNLAARQLWEPKFVSEVAQTLNERGLEPGRLLLEFTERAATWETANARNALKDLRSLGVRLALDDFGTGFSSLSHLRQLPVEGLKIDQSFVAGVDQDAGRRAIVRAVTTLGHDLGLSVTAEGIETASEAAILQDLGVDNAQGFYFARPMPGNDIVELLTGRTQLSS